MQYAKARVMLPTAVETREFSRFYTLGAAFPGLIVRNYFTVTFWLSTQVIEPNDRPESAFGRDSA